MVRITLPFMQKTIIFDFVYTLSSANIDQSEPNLGKIFMSNRIRMSSIMGPILPEQLELFALELGKIAAFDFGLCLLYSIYKYKLVSTKLGHNVYEQKISDEFDYGSSQISECYLPLNRKIELQ